MATRTFKSTGICLQTIHLFWIALQADADLFDYCSLSDTGFSVRPGFQSFSIIPVSI
jgi:hypothetical protein